MYEPDSAWRGGGGLTMADCHQWLEVTPGHASWCHHSLLMLEIRHNSLFVTSGVSPRVTWSGRDTGGWLWVRASCLKMRYYKALVSAILTNALSSMLSSVKPRRPPIPTSAFSQWQVLILGFYVRNQKYLIKLRWMWQFETELCSSFYLLKF